MQAAKRIFAPRDMTVGTPWKSILMFSVPMLIGNFVQQLYNTVDSAVVGKYVGDNALAAVGGANPMIMLLLTLFVGLATGTGILVSQYFGARDRENLSSVIGNCISFNLFLSLIVMALGTFSIKPLLKILNTPAELVEWTGDYLRIIYLYIAGFTYYNMLSGILRGLGDSFSALLFLLVSAFLNVILDLWFVISLKLGVKGVAYATAIAQGFSALLCYLKLRKMKDIFEITKETVKPDKKTIFAILKLGLPSGITQMVFSLAILLVVRIENSFGPAFVATTSVLRRVDAFAMMPNFTFGMAMTTFTGQNVGARKYDRIREGAKQGLMISVGTAALLTITILLIGRQIMDIFTDTQNVINMGMKMMKILALGYVGMAVIQTMSGVMRGAGDTLTPMFISMFTSVFMRVTLAYLLVGLSKTAENPLGDPAMIYVSLLCTWVTGAVLNYVLYKKGNWRRKLPAPEMQKSPQSSMVLEGK